MQIFRTISRLVETLEGIRGELAFLAGEVTRLCNVQREHGPAIDRLEALELSRAHFEAEMAGLLLKAEGQFKSARNAEARERQLKKSNESLADPLAEDGDTAETPEAFKLLSDDAAAREEEKLHAMRLVVAASPKTTALNHKWGVG